MVVEMAEKHPDCTVTAAFPGAVDEAMREYRDHTGAEFVALLRARPRQVVNVSHAYRHTYREVRP